MDFQLSHCCGCFRRLSAISTGQEQVQEHRRLSSTQARCSERCASLRWGQVQVPPNISLDLLKSDPDITAQSDLQIQKKTSIHKNLPVNLEQFIREWKINLRRGEWQNELNLNFSLYSIIPLCWTNSCSDEQTNQTQVCLLSLGRAAEFFLRQV